MNFKLRNLVAATLAGSFLMGFGANAMADSTTDIVNALVSKGVLTEEEGALLTKGRTDEAAGQAKALKKAGKVTVSDAIDNATIYGDVRARYELRSIDRADNGANYQSDRSRYKIGFGVETKAGDWYSDLAVAMSSSGRSDNVTFGDSGLGGGDQGMSPKDKQALYIKRAMLGWNATPWLAIEAGRMKNPLYSVNAMVFDLDIVMEGMQEKLKYTAGNTNLFANLGQWVYTGGGVAANDTQGTTSRQNMILAFQAGAQQVFVADKVSGKFAVGYYDYTGHNKGESTSFKPLIGNTSYPAFTTVSSQAPYTAVNDLAILDIPAELNYMATSNVGLRAYGEYAYNTKGSDRKNAAGTAYANLANDDTAWLVGMAVGSAKDLKSFEGRKMAKGDWNANLWYQSVGTYALDQNSIDTDIFDGRLNMEGVSLKAQYNVENNVALNFTGAWGDRKNDQYGTSYTKPDIAQNGTKYELYQFDVTYKF